MTPGRNSPKSEVRGWRSKVRQSGTKGYLRFSTSDSARRTSDTRGFTFIEIMIVLVVIGILLSLAQPSFTTSVHRAREATLKENLFIFRDVIDQYYADNGEYPTTLEAIVEGRYLRKIPKDPLTGSDSTWILVYDINEDGLEEGIFDVKSGSDLMALDGTPYNEW